MTRSLMTSTTSLVLCATLTATPMFAQETTADEPFPCFAPGGDEVTTDSEMSTALRALFAGNTVEAVADAQTPATCEADAYDRVFVAENEELIQDLTEATPEAAAAVLTLPNGEIYGADGEAIAEVVVVAQAAELVAPMVTAGTTADTETAVEAQVAEIEADLTAQAEADVIAETEVTSEAETTADSEAVVEGEVSADAAAETSSEDTTTADTVVVGDDSTIGEETSAKSVTVEETEAPNEPEQQQAAAAAEADADVDMEAESDEVVTEEVTAEDVRSSSEDFNTTVDAAPEAKAEAEADTGMSNFEKAVLLGLGAVAVGSVLDNGDEVLSNSGDRIVVQRDGQLRVLKNDDVLLRQPGAKVQTRTFDDGSTRTAITYEDGVQIVTIRGNDGTVLRRVLIEADGSRVVLFDDTAEVAPVVVEDLPEVEDVETDTRLAMSDQAALEAALRAAPVANVDRNFSLQQVREIREVRALAPQVELSTITFATASAAIDPTQAEELSALGFAIRDIVQDDPGSVFLVEGHTDAVGDAGYNLALSDRRAETVALALTEYFGVPPQNLITQGYGEAFLKVKTLTEERANRRAAVRNITELLR